jgi:hypothetical protein
MENEPKSDPTAANSQKNGPGQGSIDPVDLNVKGEFVNILLKDYELAASRFDKTDDRVIQLISIGLAFFGLVVVFVRQAPGSSTGTPTATPIATPLAVVQEASTSQPRNLDSDVWLACAVFVAVYIFLSALCFFFWEQASKKDTNKKAKKKTNERPNPYILRASIWVAWGFGLAIGLSCIIIVGLIVRPTLSNAPLELLWLAPLSLVIFHTVLIYITNSAFGLIWYCRALSKRITNVFFETPNLPVLMRFERDQIPSLFFSFGRGNAKPRTTYVLLLGTIGFLFLWVTIASFINIYASHPWEGAIMLALYFGLEFAVVFALSGISYDLEKTHSAFVEYVEEKSRDEVRRLKGFSSKVDVSADKAQTDKR